MALGAVAAGSLVIGVGTTSAQLSDSATVPGVTVGAGEVALSLSTASPWSVTQSAAHEPTVTVQRSVRGPVEVRVSAVDGTGYHACDDTLDQVRLVAHRSDDRPEAAVPLCALTTGDRRIALLDDGVGSLDLGFRVTTVGPAGAKHATAWAGRLTITVVQSGGGFSDSQQISASVTDASSAAPGAEGGSNGNSQGNANNKGNG